MECNIVPCCLILSFMTLAKANYKHHQFIPECRRDNRRVTCRYAFPKSLPKGVDEVILFDFKGDNINNNMFGDESWTQVISLDIETHKLAYTKAKAYAFHPLVSLRNLGLHGEWMLIETDTFKSVRSLNKLDLSGCNALPLDTIIDSLNGSDRVSQLAVLNISLVSLAGGRYNLGSRFAEIVGSKGISMLNLSHVSINSLNMSAFAETMCDTLDYVVAASSHLAWVPHFFGTCKSLKRIDLDNAVFLQVLPKILPIDKYYVLDLDMVPSFKFFSNIDTINANGVWQREFPKVQNITLSAARHIHLNNKNISLSNNDIEYLDLKFINISNTIESLNLSWNRMTFFQPLIMTNCSSLQHMDLSHNNLNEMATKNFTVFQTLCKHFQRLKVFNLGDNKLTDLPRDMFKYNQHIEYIDLSDNYFEQIGFELQSISHLARLNLRGNSITLLTTDSMYELTRAIKANINLTVDMRDNALLCNKCACKGFIKWAVENSDKIITDGVCISEKGHIEILDTSTVLTINRICTRTTRIALSTSLSFASTSVIVIGIVLTVKYMRRKSKAAKVNRVLNQLQGGGYHFDFPVFVASSGNDEDFVEHVVLRPLGEHLRSMIDIDRDLICTGDRHFKLGKSIAEETERSYRRCGVVLLVISPSFCASTHCNYEAHIAFAMRKPIILMFKEHVPPEEMPPVLRIIFRMYTRVTWMVQGGRYVMSTTWQNVCESILELMVEQPRLNRQDCLEVVHQDELTN